MLTSPSDNCTKAWGSRSYNLYTGDAERTLTVNSIVQYQCQWNSGSHPPPIPIHPLQATAATWHARTRPSTAQLPPLMSSLAGTFAFPAYCLGSLWLVGGLRHCKAQDDRMNQHAAKPSCMEYECIMKHYGYRCRYPDSCTTSLRYICEIPGTVYTCPSKPPAPPAKPPGSCEYSLLQWAWSSWAGVAVSDSAAGRLLYLGAGFSAGDASGPCIKRSERAAC
jgi:hypothetical protein